MTTTANFLVCDDVRREANGKQVLVGVYGAAIIVPKLPTSISHLYFRVHVRSSIRKRHVVRKIRVVRPGADDFEYAPPEPVQAGQQAKNEKGVRYHDSIIIFDVAETEFTEAGRIKVTVETDNDEVYAGSIKIVESKRRATLTAMEMYNMLLASKVFSEIQFEKAASCSELALDVMKSFSEIAKEKFPVESDEKIFMFQISKNRFRIVSMHREMSIDLLRISGQPEGVKYDISRDGKYSAFVQFSPEGPAVERFEVSFSDEADKGASE